MGKQEYFRKIPKVDVLLEQQDMAVLCEEYGRDCVADIIREVLEDVRGYIKDHEAAEIERELSAIAGKVADKLEQQEGFALRRVFNATGIILHTNLGRAPLGKKQKEAIMQALSGYTNLEYDISRGTRGKRGDHTRDLICKVTGAENAVAVNNNASAVILMLGSLARGKEVIVSRGELIEIGGKFRIPQVMEESGAILREVGTTNRTRIADYEEAITEKTGALLKVHTSNYKIVGFTEDVSVEELVELGKKYQIPVLVDLGSGVLINLEKYGLMHEPTVQEVLQAGPDAVSFSGDKLLGGPQAGIIVGNAPVIKKMENHPMMRALRLDKCVIAGLAATFKEYLDETRALKNIPVLQMLTRDMEELKAQAKEVCRIIAGFATGECKVEVSESKLGGGSLPMEIMESYAVTLAPEGESCQKMAERLRNLPIPVICHIQDEKVWLDMRTILPEELEEFKKNLEML